MMRAQFACAAALAVAIGCGPSTKDGHDDANATLTIDPPTSELLILNGAPATEDFTATVTYPDGTTKDVTTETTFAIDGSFGQFNAATLQMINSGKAVVHGAWNDKMATAQVIGRVKDIRVDPSLPPNTPDMFSGTDDPTRAPSIVYPPADVVVPRNLGDFEVHWVDAKNTVFEVSLATEFTDVRMYLPGGNGAVAGGSWAAFLASEWTAAIATDTSVTYQVRGIDSAAPGVVGSSGPRVVKLSNEDMLGGLYYWAATAQNGPYGIFRHDMAKPGQPAEQFMTTVQTSNRCVACHVLSRDGTKMAVTYDGGNGLATTVDVATSAAVPATNKWNFATYTPDATQLLTVSAGVLTVRNANDQSVLATMPAATPVTHPDLSPDGTKLVYVAQPQGGADWTFMGGQIYVRSYDQATRTFGPETPLVTAAGNNYYPSFSPDGQWVLFNHAAGGDAYNNGAASLYVIKADGSGPAMELAVADLGANLTNSWGRWAPFAQTLGTEPMLWITVSSKRDFGVRLVGAARPQIWMTPFFPNRAAGNLDPSAPAFRLPFQNIESNNHIAQWTEQVIAPQ